MTRARQPADAEARRRVVVEGVRPFVDGGRFAVKRTVGEPITVEADVFTDGHDEVFAILRWCRVDGNGWREVPMVPEGNDRFTATFAPEAIGAHRFEVVGSVDVYGSWRVATANKVAAGGEVAVDLEIGARILDGVAVRGAPPAVARVADRLRSGDSTVLDDDDIVAATRAYADPDRATSSGPLPLDVDRVRARFSTWYELFPRSASPEPGRHGTFADVVRQLPEIESMGFDVLYLPPIHPIGVSNRKGRNNQPVAGPDDLGSPWAIGSAEGGHKAVHPDLGTLADFRTLVDAAAARGIDVALDIAFQCAPDHPYVWDHPEWFRTRPDGSIQHAENPPKRYEDIVPFDFESEAWPALWKELRSVFEFWIDQGVRVFRVDNPHTKPFAFWEWVLADLRRRHPDCIFLAEAFTRPRVLERLAKVGFNQSYTYFAWRDEAWQLRDYFEELTRGPAAEYLRPNAWPNTPDILTEYLQRGGRPAFAVRAVLAATLAASYGVYGPAFEQCVDKAREPGSEEYLDSEKYEARHWDRGRSDSLVPLITRLNRLRREHPALQSNVGLRFHETDNPHLCCHSKRDEATGDTILTVVTTDPYRPQSGNVFLDLTALGVPEGAPFGVRDLLGGAIYTWEGARNYVVLDAATLPAHVLAVEAPRHPAIASAESKP